MSQLWLTELLRGRKSYYLCGLKGRRNRMQQTWQPWGPFLRALHQLRLFQTAIPVWIIMPSLVPNYLQVISSLSSVSLPVFRASAQPRISHHMHGGEYLSVSLCVYVCVHVSVCMLMCVREIEREGGVKRRESEREKESNPTLQRPYRICKEKVRVCHMAP
jgi:hypothetical protein